MRARTKIDRYYRYKTFKANGLWEVRRNFGNRDFDNTKYGISPYHVEGMFGIRENAWKFARLLNDEQDAWFAEINKARTEGQI
ncbi:MAG: hypothetical protein GY938_20060 [Ketobacter sp.]|nr:hypothetical protein [Ketobacter sp.]